MSNLEKNQNSESELNNLVDLKADIKNLLNSFESVKGSNIGSSQRKIYKAEFFKHCIGKKDEKKIRDMFRNKAEDFIKIWIKKDLSAKIRENVYLDFMKFYEKCYISADFKLSNFISETNRSQQSVLMHKTFLISIETYHLDYLAKQKANKISEKRELN